MQTELAAGLHVPAEGGVDSSAYDQWVGRWSRLFVPAVLAAGDLRPGLRVLDVSTGTGEASLAILPCIGLSDRKSTRLNSSHPSISYAVFCLKKKKNTQARNATLQTKNTKYRN